MRTMSRRLGRVSESASAGADRLPVFVFGGWGGGGGGVAACLDSVFGDTCRGS